MADDEPAFLNAITKRLTQAQHKVLGFKSGDELPAAVDQEVPDLILCDIKMPGKTGLETLAICKNIIEAHHGDIFEERGWSGHQGEHMAAPGPSCSVCATLAYAPSYLSDDGRQAPRHRHR